MILNALKVPLAALIWLVMIYHVIYFGNVRLKNNNAQQLRLEINVYLRRNGVCIVTVFLYYLMPLWLNRRELLVRVIFV